MISRKQRHLRAFTTVAACLALSACGIDGLLVQELTRNDHQLMPPPAQVTVTGRVPSLPGATIALFAAAGPVSQSSPTAGIDGAFAVSVDGATGFTNTVLDARLGGRQLLGIIPHLPKQASVLDPELKLDTAQLSPGMANVDEVTTTLALLVLAKARAEARTLTSIAHGSMTDTLIALHTKLAAAEVDLTAVLKAVSRIHAAGSSAKIPPFRPFSPVSSLDPVSLLDPAFVSATGVDTDGDGSADASTAPFDALVAKAVASFQFKACYVEDRIQVVLMARMATNAKNRNCETINPFLWAADTAGKRMLITGGVHKTTPVCSATVTASCLTNAQVDEINAALGNWVPNQVSMHDDGSKGDAVAADGIWTLAFEAPWFAVEGKQRGVRIAYKFTWGNDGAGWGGTEEFPGNQRILELRDVNDDRYITRLDHFADEASNKDKSNQLAPSKGGCGSLHWPDEEAEPGCATDVLERPVDVDGDCVVDGWPGAGTSAPLTVPCPGDE